MALRLKNKKSPAVRLTRRRLLQSIGAVATGVALTIPKFVHADSIEPVHQVTPNWDLVLQHVRQSSPHEGRDVEGLLLDWMADLILQPSQRREALIVHGSQESGKTALHSAMSTLLDDGQYLHGSDEHQLLNWGLQPGRRLAAYERGNLSPNDRERRDAALARQVHTFTFQELLWGQNSTWQPGKVSHRNSLFWYEALLDSRPLTPALPKRTVMWEGCRQKTLEAHLYLGKVEQPIPRSDFIRRLEDESSDFKSRLSRLRDS